MDKNATTALAAIGRANLALGEQWLEVSAWALGHAYRMNRAAFETFYEGPFFAAHAMMASGASTTMRDLRAAGMLEQCAGASETFELLASGLPSLMAEHAGDMNSIAATRDIDLGVGD